ncbi:MAG: ShlB/FhaC/HecB family hemolysin secretion/activation protein [Rhodocyclaceae bacterium]|nr:ShlB/FhaC/HecB family hemolysin secretion/activation protein [Rhodocyclaceae bacterium]
MSFILPWRRVCVGTAVAIASGLTLAQTSGVVLPGQVERQFRMLPQPRTDGKVPEAPLPVEPVPANADEIRFEAREIVVDGATRLPEGRLQQLTAPYLSRNISLADLYRLAAELTTTYRESGHLLSQVTVPAQEIRDGVIHLRAVEGFIDQVIVEGGDADERDLVARFGMKIRSERPLTSAVLERYMLLVNDLPGVFAYATLSPSGDRFAAADLRIHLTERRLDAGLTADNRGGRVLGNERIIADVAVADLLGRRDNTSLKAVASPGGELAYAALRHDQPIGAEGSRLALTLSATRARPEQDGFFALDLETRSRAWELAYLHPALRSRSENVYVRVALDAHDGEERVFGTRDREDHVRSLRFGLTWDVQDALGGTNIVDIEGSAGLRALGASRNGDPLLTRDDGRTDYSKLSFFAARLQDLSARWSLLAAAAGQHAHTALLSSELFAFGGEPFGRGYDPSELVGDHGAAAKLELRYAGHFELGRPMTYQAYGFYDIGRVWSRMPGQDDGDASAASVGIGTRLVFGPSVNGFIEIARPLTRPVAAEGDKDARIYAGFSARM